MPVRGSPHNLEVGCGLRLPIDDLQQTLGQVAARRFDFAALPLAAPGGQGVGAEFRPSVESGLSLEAHTWRSSVVGVVSDGLEPDTAASASDAEAVVQCLETELKWASHLGLRSVLLPPPAGAVEGGARPVSFGGSYSRAINELLLAGLFSEVSGSAGEGELDAPLSVRIPAGSPNGWSAWNRLRSFCDHHPRLSVALEFGAAAPKAAGAGGEQPGAEGGEGVGEEEEGAAQGKGGKKKKKQDRGLERWLGEPVKFVIIHASAFLPNRSGFPVLPKKLKALLLQLFRYRVQVIFMHGSDAGEEDLMLHMEYVARLYQTRPPLNGYETFAQSHFDCLQAPLQPLADNLESEVYALFETDPVKYAQYEEAVLAFLQERLAAGRSAPLTVMVVGAGRGPLVAASLRAAARAETRIEVWAVEKNPNAVHALRHRKRVDESWSCVEVVASDMRTWKAPRKADCLVSELLGSFGDNELDPECIDGALRFLADDGACIPRSYVSSLQPVSCAALWTDARGRNSGTDISDLETGYVVCLHRAFYPSAGPKDCFAFRQPNRKEESNDRYAEVEFTVETDTLVHGFAGYFDCDLYGTARISIDPRTVSEGMFSWFPMYFPLQVPVFVRKGERIVSHWWRRHDNTKVWYEWAVSEPTATTLHNPGGRSYPVGLHT